MCVCIYIYVHLKANVRGIMAFGLFLEAMGHAFTCSWVQARSRGSTGEELTNAGSRKQYPWYIT